MKHALLSLLYVVTPSLHYFISSDLKDEEPPHLKTLWNTVSDLVFPGMEITNQYLERQIILMLKLLSSNYYTAMYIAIMWGLY